MKKKISNQKLVFELLKYIPKGKVTTYGFIAAFLQINSPRVVGNILHKNETPEIYPCHRVIKSYGTLASSYAFGGLGAQKKLLQAEGIRFVNGRTDLKKYDWQPDALVKKHFDTLLS